MKHLLTGIATSIFAIVLFGCASDPEGSVDFGVSATDARDSSVEHDIGIVNISVKFMSPGGQTPGIGNKLQAIDRITVYVLDADGNRLVEQNLEREDGRARGTISVPVGNNRILDIAAFTGDIVKYIGRTANITVVQGATVSVQVDLWSTVVAWSVEPESDVKPLSLAWGEGLPIDQGALTGAVSEVYSFALETGATSVFTSPEAVYSGNAVSTEISSVELGANFYRIRAVTPYGFGPWNDVEVTLVEGLADGNISGTITTQVSIDAAVVDGGTTSVQIQVEVVEGGTTQVEITAEIIDE